jgi:hypothetical protein
VFVDQLGDVLRVDRSTAGLSGREFVEASACLAIIGKRVIEVGPVGLGLQLRQQRANCRRHVADQTLFRMRDEFAAELPFPDGLQLLIDETLRTLPLSFHVSHADQNMIEDAERREQHLKKTGPILFDVPIDTPERTTYVSILNHLDLPLRNIRLGSNPGRATISNCYSRPRPDRSCQ